MTTSDETKVQGETIEAAKMEPAKPSLRDRAASCGAEIEKVLARHDCRILAYLSQIEPVGADGSRGLLSAHWGIVSAS